jgi:hypothetical protein
MQEFEHWESVIQYKPSAVIMALQTQMHHVDWTHGGYGGHAWGGIIDCAATYYELNNLTAFIDHVLDVEHNGGRLFDKTQAAKFVGLNMDWDKSDIHAFLDWKFQSPDLLLDPELYEHYGYCISGKTAEFITRYKNIFLPPAERAPIECGLKILRARYGKIADSGALYYLPLDWDDNESYFDLEDSANGSVCEDCAEYLSDGYEHITDHGEVFCEDCYSEHVAYCESGNHEFDPDYMVEVDNQIMCEDCAESEYVKCDECEDWHPRGDSFEYAGMDLCEDCIDVHAPECLKCGIVVLDTESQYPHECEECESKYAKSPFENQYDMTPLPNGSLKVHDKSGEGYIQWGLELDYTNPRTPRTIPVKERGITESRIRFDKLGCYKTVHFRFGKNMWSGFSCDYSDPRAVGIMWDGRTAFLNPNSGYRAFPDTKKKYKWQWECFYPIVLVSENKRTI